MDDPFALLGVPRRFDIDRSAMHAAYLRRSAQLHPDRFTDPIRQREVQAEAARVNDARAILADDESRAVALLRLLGGPAREQLKTLPDGFLVDIMEVRQAMEQALAGGDAAELARFEQWAAAQRAERVTAVADWFARYDAAPDPALLHQIRIELNAWRYLERMIEQLDPEYDRPG